jgi:hypothetical protein
LSVSISLGTNEFGASKGFTLFDLPLFKVVGEGAKCLDGGNEVPAESAAFSLTCAAAAARRSWAPSDEGSESSRRRVHETAQAAAKSGAQRRCQCAVAGMITLGPLLLRLAWPGLV